MPSPMNCECGAVLVEGVSERGVLPVGGGAEIPFRRTTDHVVCQNCLRSYPVRDLIERAIRAEDDDAVIERLERLLDE